MMSRGFVVHGEHAVAFALTVSLLIPTILPKNVGTSDLAETLNALTVPKRFEQPGADFTQRSSTVVTALSTVFTAFLLPGVGPYSCAT